jgi:pyruvate/2-oxoglutarate dehydrogenase complex dihydrolipoamide dehydrogenase (E3) component
VAAGWKAAIIERKLFGGTCVNTGCTPTKTLVASAFAAHITRRLTANLLDNDQRRVSDR